MTPSDSSPAPIRRAVPSLLRGVLFNWIGFASALLYALLITPVVIRSLQQEYYGIWAFLNAAVAYSSLFYMGLGTALVRYAAHHYAVGERAELNRLVSVVVTVYSGLGILTLALGVVLAPYAGPSLLDTPGPGAISIITATVILLAARAGLMFVGSAFAGLLVAQGRTDLQHQVSVSGHLSRLVIVPWALQLDNPLLWLAVVITVTGALEVLALVISAFRLDRGLAISLTKPTAEELRRLYGFGLYAFVLQLGVSLISYTDTAVITFVLGAASVGPYVVPLQLVEYGRAIVLGLVAVLLPHLTALRSTGQVHRFEESYVRTMKLSALVAVFVNVNLIWLGPVFLRLWVGPGFSESGAAVLAWLGVASVIQAVAVHSQTPFCLAIGRARFAAIVMVCEGLVNLVLSLILVRRMGITGVAIATAIPAALVSGVLLPRYVARMVGVSLRAVARRIALPVIGFAAVMVTAHVLIRLAVPGDSWLVLMARAVPATLIALIAAWRVIAHSERRRFRVMLMRRLRPRKLRSRPAE